MERKKEADSLQSEDRKIELLLQESFGYSDEQLLKELEMAEAQAESAKMAEEEELLSGQRDLPEQNENAAPLDEFEEILKKMRERGIEPRLEKELNQPVFHGAIEPDAHLRAAETSEPERPPEADADHTDINHTPRTVSYTHLPKMTSRQAYPCCIQPGRRSSHFLNTNF